jgi:adhesin transport system outer membrane protein
MAFRFFALLGLAFFLVGASWPDGWYPKYGSGTSYRPGPAVYIPLQPGAAGFHLAAVPGATTSVPRVEGIKVSRGKNEFRVILDLSNRTDFWYWTAIDQSEIAVEFPSIQAFSGRALNTGVEDLVGVVNFEVYQSGKGGRVVVPLKRPGTVRKIHLEPGNATGRHRLIVTIANIPGVTPPANGQGMAWGGGEEIDRVDLFRSGPKGVVMAEVKPKEPPKPATVIAPAEKTGPVKPAPVEEPVEMAAEEADQTEKPATPDIRITPPPLNPDAPATPPVTRPSTPVSNDAFLAALTNLAKTHKRILAANADVEAARASLSATRGGWFPTLDITGHYGYEIQRKDEGVDDTHMPTREIDFKITQLLWDFGATTESISLSELALSQAEVTRDATVQAVLTEGITAYLDYARSQEVLGFARLSEANIKRQAEVEDIRVKRGSGFSSDVLQAKAQLAGADSRRVQAEGALIRSGNRYNAVFGRFPDAAAKFGSLKMAPDLLPPTMAQAVEISIAGNPQIEAVRIASEIARANTRIAEATEYYPSFNLIGEAKYKQDVGGTIGFKGEQIVRVELTFPFNLGGTSMDTLQASKHAFLASDSRLADAREQIAERTRVAWQRLQSAAETSGYLHNQANIAAEFLRLARKERELGKRTLIDVLAGETAFTNASADAASADIDKAIAGYTLLAVMGTLSAGVIAN